MDLNTTNLYQNHKLPHSNEHNMCLLFNKYLNNFNKHVYKSKYM